jgi:ketosteroid isomerase-like protein
MMNKLCFLLFVVAIFLSGCQPKAEPEPVDLNAVKSELNALTDSYFDAWVEKDLDMLKSMVADWGLFCGTDPDEIWNKDEILELWKEYFTDSTATIDYTSMDREISASPDGSSAIIVDQGIFASWSPKILIRQTFHAVKTGDSWQVGYIGWSFLPRNEEVGLLNKALE